MTLEELARDMLEKRAAYDKAAADKTAAMLAADAAETALYDALEESKQFATVLQLGPPWGNYHVKRRRTIFGKIENEDKFLAWLNETARTEDVYNEPTARKKVLNQYARDVEDGVLPPPPGFSWTETRKITASKR